MRVFVAGASGALGSRLVPQLIQAGHDVVGIHHSPASAELLRTLGAKPVMLDLLDAGAVREAVLQSAPEAIVHQATALADATWGRNFDNVFARTNQLRTEGTDALLTAAREADVRRFVAQSFASYRYAREGGRSRPTTIRSTRLRRRTGGSPSPRWPISSKRSPRPVGSRCATGSLLRRSQRRAHRTRAQAAVPNHR